MAEVVMCDYMKWTRHELKGNPPWFIELLWTKMGEDSIKQKETMEEAERESTRKHTGG